MLKKIISMILMFLFIGIVIVASHNNSYIKDDRLIDDIQQRLKNNSNANIISNFIIVKQKDMEDGKLILYRYARDNTNFIACSVYERTDNNRFKFINDRAISTNQGDVAVLLEDNKKNIKCYLIYFGYNDSKSPNKFVLTLGNKSFIKEHYGKEYFIEAYSMNGQKVGIRPIYNNE